MRLSPFASRCPARAGASRCGSALSFAEAQRQAEQRRQLNAELPVRAMQKAVVRKNKQCPVKARRQRSMSVAEACYVGSVVERCLERHVRGRRQTGLARPEGMSRLPFFGRMSCCSHTEDVAPNCSAAVRESQARSARSSVEAGRGGVVGCGDRVLQVGEAGCGKNLLAASLPAQ